MDLTDALVRIDVGFFSREVLGMPYSSAEKILYTEARYKKFTIKKKDGTPRVISEPKPRLKELQYKILEFLKKISPPPKNAAHGFVAERSIVTNAAVHSRRKPGHILNVDIEDFFTSISFYRVRGLLIKQPFGFTHRVATVIAHACTDNGHLPQGAPTSPFLSNLICRRLDSDLLALARRNGATYTRYSDDLTFSLPTRTSANLPPAICTLDGGMQNAGGELVSIISQHGFSLNEAKTRISNRRRRLEVTGLTINVRPNVKKRFLDSIRGALHAWEKYGNEKFQAGWNQRRIEADSSVHVRQLRQGFDPRASNAVWGRLMFLKMVRGENDAQFVRLADKYNTLCEMTRRQSAAKESAQFRLIRLKPYVLSKQDAEKALYVIEWSGDLVDSRTGRRAMVGGQGTAFLYGDHGLCTCDHIFEGVAAFKDGTTSDPVYADSPDLQDLEMNAIDSRGLAWPVRIRKRDSRLDLAVLSFVEGKPTGRYFIAAADVNAKSVNGLLAGFPNWSIGRPVNFISAYILSRYPRFGLNYFEISKNIRSGNSGGPYLDEFFRVCGVAQRGATQNSGNDECLSVANLDSWLSSLD